MFTEPADPKGTPGDCFGDCSCVCNRGCTESCGTTDKSPMCLQSCGCPANVNKTKDLLEAQEEYFDMPLDPRSSEELSAEFQGQLADVINKKYKGEQKKEREVLDKKLKKIERKWDEYAENARKLGVNATVFCNQTCSHDCFLEADQSTYDILTKCLINKCECFRPKLPKADKYISFDSLIALKNIITEEEERSSDIAEILEKQADKLEDEAEGLDKTADIIDAVIEETLKAANATKEHKETNTTEEHKETAPTEVKDTTNTTVTEEPAAPVELATPVEPETPVEPIAEPEPVTPVEPIIPEPTPAIPEPTPAEPVAPAEPAAEPEPAIEPVVPDLPVSPLEPVLPSGGDAPSEEAETPATSPNSTNPYDEILDIPTAKTQNCNLTCFRECLDLKKYVPFPVIEQCIDVKCHCKVDNLTNNFQNFISVNTADAVVEKMSESLEGKHSASVLGIFVMAMLIFSLIGAVLYLLHRYTQEQEKTRAYGGIGMDDNTAYERLA